MVSEFCCFYSGALTLALDQELSSSPASSRVIQTAHCIVVNAIDIKPVSRVLISSEINPRMTKMTDAEGRFSFEVHRGVTNTASAAGAIAGAGSDGAAGSAGMRCS